MWCVSLYVQGYDGIWIDGWNGWMDDQSKKIQDGNKTEKEKEKREQNGNHVVVELELLEVGIMRRRVG